MKNFNANKKERLRLELYSNPLRNAALQFELGLCCLLLEKYLPSSLVDPLIPVLKNGLPRDKELEKNHLGKQKASNLIREGIYFLK